MVELTRSGRIELARRLASRLEVEVLTLAPLTHETDRMVNLAEDVRRLLDDEQPAHEWPL